MKLSFNTIRVRDLERALKFYQGVLGLSIACLLYTSSLIEARDPSVFADKARQPSAEKGAPAEVGACLPGLRPLGRERTSPGLSRPGEHYQFKGMILSAVPMGSLSGAPMGFFAGICRPVCTP